MTSKKIVMEKDFLLQLLNLAKQELRIYEEYTDEIEFKEQDILKLDKLDGEIKTLKLNDIKKCSCDIQITLSI